MTLQNLLIISATGGVVGWLAALIKKRSGVGLFGNILVGILGAFLGEHALGQFGIVIVRGTLGTLLDALIGVLALLLGVMLLKRT